MEIQRLQNLSLKAMTSLGRSRSQSSRLVPCLIFLRFLRRNTGLSRATSESERMDAAHTRARNGICHPV